MSLKRVNILLADDDIDDCGFFTEALTELALSTQLTAVHDGEQLMKYLGNAANKLPDIVYLDLNMPRKNGFECLAEIKQNGKLKGLPIIMFSTSFEQGVVNMLYENGAKYFIRKPSEFAQFKMIIQQSLALIADGDNTQPSREDFVVTVQTPTTTENIF